jgi:PAS domain S-box-containing protein
MLGYPVLQIPEALQLSTGLPELEELDSFKEMTDPAQVAALQLLTIITGASYQGKPELLAPIAYRMINLVLENGHSYLAAYTYGVFGTLLCGHLNDIEMGYHAGQIALHLQNKYDAKEMKCKVNMPYDSFIRHWKEHHRLTIPAFSETIKTGLETGDIVYASYCCIWSCGYLFLTGDHLNYVEDKQRQYAKLLENFRQENGLYPVKIWRQLSLNLQGRSIDKYTLIGESYSIEDAKRVEIINVVLTNYFELFAKLILAYVFRKFKDSFEYTNQASIYSEAATASMLSGGYVYYDSLCRLAHYSNLEPNEQKKVLEKVHSNLQKIQVWRRYAPINFDSKYALIRAEIARVTNQHDDAIKQYERALKWADENQFSLEKAITAERAADFFLELGADRIACSYITEAANAYKTWGAEAKVVDLKEQFPQFLNEKVIEKNDSTDENESHFSKEKSVLELDAKTLIKASQTLSGEIELDRLLTRLIKLAMENACAQRGVLVLESNNQLEIRIIASHNENNAEVLHKIPLDSSNIVPTAIIRYVFRTGENIVLSNASKDSVFGKDPYIIQKQSLSILCMSIRSRNRIIGVLYLENDLAQNIFTDERLSVLNTLLTQATISLENSELFEKQRLTEEELRKSERKFRAIFNQTFQLTGLLTPKGRLLDINKTALDFAGIEESDVIGKPFWETKWWNHSTKLQEELRQAIQQASKGRFVRFGAFHPGSNGKQYYIDTSIKPVFDEYDNVSLLISEGRDITERKKSEETFRTLVESIVGISGKACFEKIVNELCKWFDAEVAIIGEIKDKKIHVLNMLLDGEKKAPFEYSLEETPCATVIKKGPLFYSNDIGHRFPAGKDLLELEAKGYAGTPVYDQYGTAIGVICVLSRKPLLERIQWRELLTILSTKVAAEIERIKNENELYKTRKLESVGILAGGIAHDYNNLLTAILGNISLIKYTIESHHSIYKRLTEAEQAAVRAQSLTQQLLTFSKGGDPVKESANVKDLITETATFSLHGSNVSCTFHFQEDLWLANVDKGQFCQVIQNLVINANQAMSHGGTIEIIGENITISTQDTYNDFTLQEGKYVKLIVKDKGTGISEDNLQLIFDPYFTTKDKGSGLGLATSYSIIKNHQGHISVDSKLGIGTTFTLYLPKAEKEETHVPDINQKQVLAGQGRILIMDDEKMIREVASSMLKQIGYDVDTAADGHEAIEMYKKSLESGNRFDALIVDLTIPGGIGGKETIEKLIEIDPQVKAIVSSGYSSDPIMAHYQKYGFCGIISKPYKISELGKLLQNVLE